MAIVTQQNKEMSRATSRSRLAQTIGDKGFEAANHKLVLTDIYGHPKHTQSYTIDANIIKTQTKFPNGWDKNQRYDGKPTRKTLKKLQQQRRESLRPSITFDIDGDGQVSQRDMKIAYMFDKDGDGRLNTAEKAECLAALRSGFESQLEKSGDDAVTLARPLRKSKSETANKFFTRTDMLKGRKQSWIAYEVNMAKSIENLSKPGGQTGQSSMASLPVATQVIVEGRPLVTSQRRLGYKSLCKLRSETTLKAREAQGLTKTVQQKSAIDFYNPGPTKRDNLTLNWVAEPAINARSTLIERRKQQKLADEEKFTKIEKKTDAERIVEREANLKAVSSLQTEERLKKLGKEPGRSLATLKQERRDQTTKEASCKFFKPMEGIHPPMPKFVDSRVTAEKDERQFWKNQSDYVPKPKNQSATLFKQKQQWFKKPNTFVTADIMGEEPPIEKWNPFKQGRVAKPPPKPVAEKPNKIYRGEPLAANKARKKKSVMRWSEVQIRHTRMKNRLLDEPPVAGDLIADNAPMYSSFGRNGIFNVPVKPQSLAKAKSKPAIVVEPEVEGDAEKPQKVQFDVRATPRSDVTSQLGGRKARNAHEGLVGANQTLFRRVAGKFDDVIARKPPTGFTEKLDSSQAPTAAGTANRRDSFMSGANPVSSGRKNREFSRTGMSNIENATEQFGAIRTLTRFGVRTNGFSMSRYGALGAAQPEAVPSTKGKN